jgi:hypothetical protein
MATKIISNNVESNKRHGGWRNEAKISWLAAWRQCRRMAAMAMKIMKNGVNERNISRREMKMASASMAAGSVASAKALRHRWQSDLHRRNMAAA